MVRLAGVFRPRRRSSGFASPAAAKRKLSLILLLAALGACGLVGHRRDHSGEAAASSRRLYSPNGEPLSGGPLGHPDCREAMSAWFDRTDTDRDGSVDRDEYIADARRQFAVMDLDKDGMVTPAELAQYRAPYEVDAATSTPETAEASKQSEQGSGTGSHRQRHRTAEHGSGGGGGGSNDRPDPVMSADVNLRYQVSLADFLAYAERRFAEMDGNGDGRLSKAEVLQSCPKAD